MSHLSSEWTKLNKLNVAKSTLLVSWENLEKLCTFNMFFISEDYMWFRDNECVRHHIVWWHWCNVIHCICHGTNVHVDMATKHYKPELDQVRGYNPSLSKIKSLVWHHIDIESCVIDFCSYMIENFFIFILCTNNLVKCLHGVLNFRLIFL